jgi:stage II sporulation SpoAA-like protein
MTHSSFDSSGGNAERGGTRFTPPAGTVDFQPPTEKPSIEASTEEGGKIVVVHIGGKLHTEDYKHFVPTVEKSIQEHGTVRMLVQMHNFRGWDAGALWQDIKFDARHFDQIERLALVGEATWEKWMAAFCKPFTTATVRYFPSDQLTAAHDWILAK